MMTICNQLFFLFGHLSLVLFVLLSGKMGPKADAFLQPQYSKLFIFGDSFLDTGNTKKDESSSWKQPYGITFPGKPAGRFSDGQVLTDYVAKYLGLRSPLPYEFRKVMPQFLKDGLNFAYGGSGVFNTMASYPNMTVQINFFEQLIEEKVYTLADLNNSVALINVGGNDYKFFLDTNGSAKPFPSFISSVVNQTITNLIRIQKLGVNKIVVDGMHSVGCIPLFTAATSFQNCNKTFNDVALRHNFLLNQSVDKLNKEAKDHTTFVIINLYDSFFSVLNNTSKGNTTNALEPCCVGVSSQYSCGSVDKNNMKKYVVCENPKSAFFWDLFHPTQAGWDVVFNKLVKNSLHQLKY